MILEVTLAGAFLGGALALLSPCSALLLPSFFAYAFKSKQELAARTGVFLLGLSTLFIPLGMGASFAGSLILDYRAHSIWIIGLLLIAFGVIEFFGLGFTLLPQRFSQQRMDGSWSSAYIIGLVYGFAGFCSGPLLGAVLTMAASATHPLHGGLVLFAYASGMAVPLFVLAALWDRYELGSRKWLRGKSITIGPLRVHTTQAVTGTLFILLGLLFIVSGGTVAFERFYMSLGLLQWSMQMQARVSEWTAAAPDALWLAVFIACLLLGAARARQTRKRRKGTEGPSSASFSCSGSVRSDEHPDNQ